MLQVGGPRYVPRSVNKAAFNVLDALFPMGAFSRRAVSLLFRLWLHPGSHMGFDKLEQGVGTSLVAGSYLQRTLVSGGANGY